MISASLIILVIIGLGLLFRYWRRKEMESFMEADISMFEELAELSRDLKFAETEARPVANLVPTVPGQSQALKEPGALNLRLKDRLMDDVHAEFLKTLGKVVEDHYYLMVGLPLDYLVKTDARIESDRLPQYRITCLLCEKERLSPVCAIQLKGSSISETDTFNFIEKVFTQIDIPLFSFPLSANYSVEAIEEVIGSCLEDGKGVRQCPKCGAGMALRLATKGRNAGKTFWVCKEFPACKGIARFGTLDYQGK